jgi:hypothetical protein
MTKVRCLAAEEIAEVLSLGAGHPRRRHLDECPRCRALVTAYHDFLEPAAVPEGARPAEAGTWLSEELARAIGSSSPPARPARGQSLLQRVGDFFAAPALRPVWAAAAVVVVAGVVLTTLQLRPEGEPVLRGERPAALALEPAQPGPAASLRLRWQPLEGADSYQVRVYSTGLEELARLEPVANPEMVLRREQLPPGIAPGATLLWRVAALRGGDDVALSPVGRLRAP